MKLELFFEKFDQFANAPDAVEKMRELILESAIRGKLVPQDRRDEPASELLKRVGRMQDGQFKKRAPLPPVGNDAYLELPAGWDWTRLGNTGRIFNGDSVSESGKGELSKVAEGLPFIATKDVGYGRDVLAYDNGLKVPLNDPRFKVAQANAVLICAEGGSAGRKIGITDRDICFGNKLYANEVSAGIHHRYIFYVYQASTFFREFAGRMTGIIGGIARSQFLSLPIPLPPEKEQKRIVAKVDELMALCDRLEAQQQERETQHTALARASLARFADVPTPPNLNFIFHKSYVIPPADLRKSILALAVQGKLVPQDPNDETAPSLLARITRKKQSLIEAKTIRQGKVSRPHSALDAPTALPSGWEWVNVDSLCFKVTDGTHFTPQYAVSGVRFVSAKDIVSGKLVFDRCKFITREEHEKLFRRCNPGYHDIVISKSGSIGTVALVEDRGEFSLFESLALLKFDQTSLFPPFLVCALTHACSSLTAGHIRGVGVKHLHLDILRGLELALPPLAEQRRIVAKVDQLMALVDTLETQLVDSREKGQKLLEAIVGELTLAS